MAYDEERALDMTKRRGRAGAIMPVTLRRGEKGQRIMARITDDGEPFALSGYAARFCAVNPDGSVLVANAAVEDAQAGIVSYTVTDALTAAAGIVRGAYFELMGEGEVLTTDTLPIIILPDADLDEGQAAEYHNLIDEMLAELQEAIDDMGELVVPLMSDSVRGGAKVGNGLAMNGEALGLSGESYTSIEKAKLGGIEAGANAYVLPPATTDELGGVKPDGTTVTVDSDGTIHGASSYDLPTMSATVKGGAKVGDGLAVSGETLSLQGESYTAAEKAKLAGVEAGANAYVLPKATDQAIGGVKVDGVTVTVDSDGTISATGGDEYALPTMSATTKGGAKLGGGLTVANDTLAASPITTGQIESVAADSAPTGTDVLNLTGLSYLWAKVKAWASSAFAAITHSHGSATTNAAGFMSAADKAKLDGVESGANAYELPTASATTKGGAKVGSGLTMTGDVLSADGYTLPAATTSALGGVKPDGTTITADADGTIHGSSTYELPPATTSTLGGVKPDGTTVTVDADGTIHSAGSSSKPYQLWKPDGSAVVVETAANSSVKEGVNTTASDTGAHAEGVLATASGYASHAEGYYGTASSWASHVEGDGTAASNSYAHAEGKSATASGYASHAQNMDTIAQRAYQTALGKYNVADTGGADVNALGTYAVIVGNGTFAGSRSNALGVRWDGTMDVGNMASVSGDNHAYPLFIWTSSMTNPESYTGTYPVSPCFVYYVPNNGLYYCTN